MRKTRAVADRENAKEITLPGASETAREGRGSLSRPGRRDKDEADKRTDEGARGRGYSVSRPRATRAHAPSRPAVQSATTPSSSSSSPPYHPARCFPTFHLTSLVRFRAAHCVTRATRRNCRKVARRRFERERAAGAPPVRSGRKARKTDPEDTRGWYFETQRRHSRAVSSTPDG